MANLPSQYPHLALHLTDRAHTPLISSARIAPQSESLSLLSRGALSAHESALRLGLGAPQRIMVEHAGQGPVLLQSFMRADTPSTAANSHSTNPLASSQTPAPTTNTANGEPTTDELPTEPLSPTDVDTEAQAQTSPTNAVERRLQQLQLHGSTPALDGSGAATPTPGGAAGEEADSNAPPMLIGIVVAPNPDAARHARRAAAQLEHVGRAIQARWAEAQEKQMRDGEEGEGRQQQQQQQQQDGAGGGGGAAGAAAGDAGD
ncbi:hypothetical protein GGS26DRAFT_543532 [Hypomontagnella submonticulosa]|nr:hypothetical protein GGS26DRAFT_543532 [Hypomontagnella submonticulosa]